jgi:hypothetical protein
MRAGICSVIASVIAVGCATAGHETTVTDRQGLAELQVDAAPLLAAGITRVTVDGAGRSQELALNFATGTYDGTIFLPSGSQSLVASAFASDTLVAQSRPTPVEVQPGAITRVVIRILDLSMQGPPVYGPIIDSLTFPTSTEAGASVSFAISVVAPAGDPVTYQWSSSCADSTFSAPTAGTTSWSKPTEGACTITVLATSNGFTTAQSFGIIVFPAGAGSGAVNVSGVLVTAPQMFLSLPEVGCFTEIGLNASCPGTIASPSTAQFQLSVFNWGNSPPGTLELSDSCGGRFGTSSRSPGDIVGFWLPPVGGGLCILTARAVNGDGLVSTVTAAVLTHAGTPATPQPPTIGIQISSNNGSCFAVAPGDPVTCPVPVQAGTQVSLFGSTGWADGHPGSLTINDDCAGPQPAPSNTSFFGAVWTVPTAPATCTVTVRATDLEGVATDAIMHYPVAP